MGNVRPHRGDAIAAVLRWPTPRAREWTEALAQSAGQDPQICAIVAMGSSVRPDVSSVDLDLVLISDAPRDHLKTPPFEVDLRTYRTADVDEQIARGNDLLGWAIRFGRPLCERDRFWDHLVAVWRDKLPWPSVLAAETRVAQALERLRKVAAIGDLDAAHEQALAFTTHLARLELLRKSVYPISRPELPRQLREIGAFDIADLLGGLIAPAAERSTLIATALARGSRSQRATRRAG